MRILRDTRLPISIALLPLALSTPFHNAQAPFPAPQSDGTYKDDMLNICTDPNTLNGCTTYDWRDGKCHTIDVPNSRSVAEPTVLGEYEDRYAGCYLFNHGIENCKAIDDDQIELIAPVVLLHDLDSTHSERNLVALGKQLGDRSGKIGSFRCIVTLAGYGKADLK